MNPQEEKNVIAFLAIAIFIFKQPTQSIQTSIEISEKFITELKTRGYTLDNIK